MHNLSVTDRWCGGGGWYQAKRDASRLLESWRVTEPVGGYEKWPHTRDAIYGSSLNIDPVRGRASPRTPKSSDLDPI